MVRRIMLGLVAVGVFGAFANAAPIMTLSEKGAGLATGEFTDGTYTIQVFVHNMHHATTMAGNNQTGLLGFSFTFGAAGDAGNHGALTYSNYVRKYSAPGAFLIDDINTAPTGGLSAVNLGTGGFGVGPAIGAGDAGGLTPLLIAEFDVTIAGGDASNTHLNIIAQGPGYATLTDPDTLLTVNTGFTPGDAVTNLAFGSGGLNTERAGQPLVPEPATIALMLAACGGGLIRRRRS